MKKIHRFYRIKAKTDEVYAALTNAFSIELWTGSPAVMSEQENSEFSLFDGDISGMNLLFEKNARIEQEWYFGDQEEKSIVTIQLTSDKLYTKIELTHTNVPHDAYEDMRHGWDTYYFGGLKDFFEK